MIPEKMSLVIYPFAYNWAFFRYSGKSTDKSSKSGSTIFQIYDLRCSKLVSSSVLFRFKRDTLNKGAYHGRWTKQQITKQYLLLCLFQFSYFPHEHASRKKEHIWEMCPSFLQLFGKSYMVTSFSSRISLNQQLDSTQNLHFSDVVCEAQKVKVPIGGHTAEEV